MRHLKNRNKLGVNTSHRLAMLRNLATQVLEHKQIKTTITRAKNIRGIVDKLILLAKKNDLQSKKRIFSFVKTKASVKMLAEYSAIYQNRQSGFTQIYKLRNRAGDNSQMALIRMIDLELLEKAKDVNTKDTIKEIRQDLAKTAVKGKNDAASKDVAEVTKEGGISKTAVKVKNDAASKDDSTK